MIHLGKFCVTVLALGLMVFTLGGCSGYGQSASGGSGVQMYGTVDAGVSHTESR